MSEIQFPSPTALLGPSISLTKGPSPPVTATAPLPTNAKRKSVTSTSKSKAPKLKADPATKPKQSKSRNGCTTCKGKRLKCDETKPACHQCAKRGVSCGGYKKDWKWKEFNEGMMISRAPAPSRPRKAAVKPDLPTPQSQSSPASDGTEASTTPQTILDMPIAIQPPSPVQSPPDDNAQVFSQSTQASRNGSSPNNRPLPLDLSIQGIGPCTSSGLTPALQGICLPPRDDGITQTHYMMGPHDVLDVLSANNFSASMHEAPLHAHDHSALESGSLHIHTDPEDIDEEEVEDIIRQPSNMNLSRGMSQSFDGYNEFFDFDVPDMFLNQQPMFSPYSPEMLLQQFDKSTCGVLSVRNGQENPWRTLIFPLIHDSPALFHAIASMAALHCSKQHKDMKVKALEHRFHSIKLLNNHIHNMRPDIAISITLVLAFAESWDADFTVSTGIKHLQGAKSFLTKALNTLQPSETPLHTAARLRFLCNTWVYMDVIARLTSVESDDSEDFDSTLWTSIGTFGGLHEIDPLMGCASTMFPLIGRVANLVRKVRFRQNTSIAIVSQASELKRALDDWKPPHPFNEPEDERCDIRDALQTAEAYRWATLLYLHQAVPEIPSRSSGQLAKKALINLAAVDLGSRTIIVQIYPLLAAGCEAWNAEDREWVRERWSAMARIMNIGNIDKCLDVTQEVWARRDAYDAEVTRRRSAGRDGMFSPVNGGFGIPKEIDAWGLSHLGRDDDIDSGSFHENDMSWGNPRGREIKIEPESLSPGHIELERTDPQEVKEELHPDRTVRGKQHWIGVMKDFNWEVLLG